MPRDFIISAAHMEAFSQQQKQRFEDEMAAYLREKYPVEARKLGDPLLREMIRDGAESAKSYDITAERDVARYVELMLVISPSFDDSDETPWAYPILHDNRLTGSKKIRALYEHLAFGESEKSQGRPGR